MKRTAAILVLFAGLAAWASAQSPVVRTADDRIKLFRMNRDLLTDLLDHDLKVTDSTTTLDRADDCRRAAGRLLAEIRNAANNTRAAELTELLTLLVEQALAPTLAEARTQIHPKSKEFERLKTVHTLANQDLAETQGTVKSPTLRSKLGTLGSKVGIVE